MNHTLRIPGLLAALGLVFGCFLPARACLRSTLDMRAVQWSPLIVQAKLVAVHDAQPIPTTQPATHLRYQLYDFNVTTVLDGKATVGQKITVVRFGRGDPDGGKDQSSICGEDLTAAQVGKAFLLLLAPEASLPWSRDAAQADPRPARLNADNPYAVVHLEPAAAMDSDALADFRRLITDTRAADSQFSPDDARLQTQTLVNAADDTEAQEAEHSLLQMGPKALDVLRDARDKSDGAIKAHLQRIIDAVSCPGLSDTPVEAD